MSIYDENFFAVIKRHSSILSKIALVIIAIVLFAVLYFFITDLTSPKPIEVTFFPNEFIVDSQNPDSVLMTVKIRNITDDDAANIPVSIETVDYQNLLIGVTNKQNETFTSIEKNGVRVLKYNVRLAGNAKIQEGEYKIRIQTTINRKDFKYDATLNVKLK